MLIAGLVTSLLAFLSSEEYLSLKPRLLETLLALFCFVLFVLVVISDTVVVWAGMFRTRAAIFHAQLPGNDRQLFWSTALEGGLWASWAVAVLAVPLVLVLTGDAVITMAQERNLMSGAWGSLIVGQVPALPKGAIGLVGEGLLIAMAMSSALIAFVACCIACGAMTALLLARLIPALRRGLKGLLFLVVAVLVVSAFLLVGGHDRRMAPVSFMQEIIGRLAFAENPLFPSWWTQQAITAASAGRWNEWFYYLALLTSTAAVVAITAEWYAARRLRRDLDALTGRPDPARRARSRPWRLLPGLTGDLALLVAKDLRLFRRDPAQVLQFTMFFGLLAFYLLMLPRIGRAFLFDEWWRPIVSLMSLTAVAMALATFTGRFVFPLLSLEGRRLWVLALAPWPRERVVTAKFAFALLVGLPVSVALVVLSGVMLTLPWGLIAYEVLVMICMAVGFSAVALGLGARLADYGQDNPAKLVAGYGGTINLLMTLLYAAMLLMGAAIPLFSRHLGPWRWSMGIAWTMVVTAVWTWVFLRLAWRWFGRFDLAGNNPG
jgi:ABC-2 type transport system permease protein